MLEPLLIHGLTQTGRGWDEAARHLVGERYRPLARTGGSRCTSRSRSPSA